jgi:hypothetical protein
LDEDFFGKYDVIEQFECKFFPRIITDNRFDGAAWSVLDECKAKHQPLKIKLFYRWRVYVISDENCGTQAQIKKSPEAPLSSPRPPLNVGEP